MKAKLIGPLVLVVLMANAACGDVADKIAPSMVRIQFKDISKSGGTGFLVEGNYIVTAAHVVWPYAESDITFNNGTVYSNVQVIAYDHLADLAFLGPIDTSEPHFEFADAENESEGNKTFTVGYAGWRTPNLSINEGTLEGVTTANSDIDVVSSTARSIGGMSGGPMTNDRGEVIGALVRSWDRGGGESMGPTSYTLRDRLNKIARGEEVSQLGSRLLSKDGGRAKQEFVLRGRWDTAAFSSGSSSASIQFDTPVDVEYGFFDERIGVQTSTSEEGITQLTPELRSIGLGVTGDDDLWFLVVKQRIDRERTVLMTSSVPLTRYHDPDDGRHIQPGDTVSGVLDTPVDIDWYTIHLQEKEGIEMRVTHPLFVNAVKVTIEHPAMPPYEIRLGQGSAENIRYRSQLSGTHIIAIQRAADSRRAYRGYSFAINRLFGSAQIHEGSGHQSPQPSRAQVLGIGPDRGLRSPRWRHQGGTASIYP